MTARDRDPAWGFWQKSREALDALNDAMQCMATAVAQDDPALQVPHHVVKDVRRNVNRFSENFSLLVREQKRKSGR